MRVEPTYTRPGSCRYGSIRRGTRTIVGGPKVKNGSRGSILTLWAISPVRVCGLIVSNSQAIRTIQGTILIRINISRTSAYLGFKVVSKNWPLEPFSLVLGREGSPPIISTKRAAWVILAVHPPYIRPESRRYGSIDR